MRSLPSLAALVLLAPACAKTPVCEDDFRAYVTAQRFITERLRSPSTADFPPLNARGVSVTPTTLSNGQCAFDVITWVDAENGFGGTVRESFFVTVAPRGSSSYRLVSLTAI